MVRRGQWEVTIRHERQLSIAPAVRNHPFHLLQQSLHSSSLVTRLCWHDNRTHDLKKCCRLLGNRPNSASLAFTVAPCEEGEEVGYGTGDSHITKQKQKQKPVRCWSALHPGSLGTIQWDRTVKNLTSVSKHLHNHEMKDVWSAGDTWW